jgi:hypothetical protein
MQIDQKTFRALIPSSKHAGLTFWRAARIVQRTWCGPMTVHSLCPGFCAQCQSHLLDAFQLETARNPEALLTYNLKLAYSKFKEIANQKPEPKTMTSLFVPAPENPFERIAREATSPSC